MKRSEATGGATIHLAFLALFPGFFFYHSAVATGAAGPFLAGYFSPVALVFTPFLAAFYLRRINRNKHLFTRTDAAFLFFLLYFFFVVALNFSLRGYREIARDHILSILQFAVVFAIFKMADFSSGRFRWAAFTCLIGMTAIVFSLSMNGLLNLREQGEFGNSDVVATYQGFAFSYLATLLVLVPFTKSLPLRLALYAIGVPALFINGARSELVAMMSLIALTEILHTKHRFAALSLSLILLSLFGIYLDDIVRLLPDNRELELLDLSQSTSWGARHVFSLYAQKIIAAHPILGDYGNYYDRNCCAGTYAHNILSAWVDLGLFGFVYLLGMLVLPIYFLVADIAFGKTKRNVEEFVLTFSLFFITLLLLFTAKEFTYMLSAAALGRYARYRSEQSVAPGTARSVFPIVRRRPARHLAGAGHIDRSY